MPDHDSGYLTLARIEGYRRRHDNNTYRIDGNIGHIALLRGDGTFVAETMVDADLVPGLLHFARWRPAKPDYKTLYAMGNRRRHVAGEGRPVSQLLGLHRAVLELCGFNLAGMVVDHINGETLDNRRANLRACTYEENRINHRHARYITHLQAALRQLIHCPHTRQDCACKRAAIKLLG